VPSSIFYAFSRRYYGACSWRECCRVVANKRTTIRNADLPERAKLSTVNRRHFVVTRSATTGKPDGPSLRCVDRRSIRLTPACQCPVGQPNQTTRRPMKYFVIGRQKRRRRRLDSRASSGVTPGGCGGGGGYRRVCRRHEAVKSLIADRSNDDQ